MTAHLYFSLDGRDASTAAHALMSSVASRRRLWRTPVHVWLSGGVARPFMFGPVAGLSGWREVHVAAAAAAPVACGLSQPCVACVEEEPREAAVLATAVEESIIDALYDAAREHKTRIASIRPAWALAIERLAKGMQEGLLCCRERDAVTVLSSQSGKWALTATYSPAPGDVEIECTAQRLQASLNLDNVHFARLEQAPEFAMPSIDWIESSALAKF